MRNFCKDCKAARRHLREYHKLKNKNDNAIEGNDIKKLSEIKISIDGGFDVTKLEQGINHLNLVSDLNNERGIHREFIKHFNKKTAKECLVAIS